MSKEESGASEIFDVVLYMFVLGPAVEWCLKSPKINKGRTTSRRGILLAVLLLSAIAAFKLSFELVGRDSNHFVTLGLRVDATPTEIKKAYKAASIKYHPDKAPDDPKAAEKFMRYQSAYEVLKDPQNRDIYNKFGWAGLDERSGGTSQSFTSMALFYVIWLVVGYLLTMGKGSEDSRTWAFSGLLALAVYEYQCRILSVDYTVAIFPYSTVQLDGLNQTNDAHANTHARCTLQLPRATSSPSYSQEARPIALRYTRRSSSCTSSFHPICMDLE